MTVTLHSTDKIITLATPTGDVPGRIWEGVTESGIPVHAIVTRIAVHKDEDASQFERELVTCRPPSSAVAKAYDVIDARLVL
jgi:hypothetical protein